MKLYTEEQVRQAVKSGFKLAMETDGGLKEGQEECINSLKPIELPSDEEMGVIALNIASTLEDKLDSRQEAFYLGGFLTCNQWLKEQILNQNK